MFWFAQLAHKAFKIAQSLEPLYVNCWIGQVQRHETNGQECVDFSGSQLCWILIHQRVSQVHHNLNFILSSSLLLAGPDSRTSGEL